MGHSFTVSADQADRRLDRVLRGLYPGVPLAAIMKALRKGEVRVDGRKEQISRRLAEGETVTVPWPSAEAGKTLVEQLSSQSLKRERLKILFRSEDAICVDKPAGLLSQPDRKNGDSLITRLWADLSWSRNDFRPASISRLDRNVSGAVLVALNAPVLRVLSSLMRDGEIQKIYTALVHGNMPDEGEVNLPLLKDESRNIVTVDGSGSAALTRYRTLERCRDRSLVEIELLTGRPHQARVHMSAAGHPIVGDVKYGGRGKAAVAGRLFLHASRLVLPDNLDLPKELRCSIIESTLPKEFTNP